MGARILVPPLSSAAARDWDSLRRSFRGRPALPLGQSWQAEPGPLFAPGQVRLGLSGMSLSVLASFRDRDVFNPVSHFGTPAFPHGDTFEIFLQPAGQAAYFEFHVTPGGALLQLRWPEPMRNLGLNWEVPSDPLLPYKLTRWRIRVRTRVLRSGWEVHAEIPMRRIFEDVVPWDGGRLRANFARYDYTRGRLRPVLSATAPLTAPDFHRTTDWTELELRFRS